MAVLGGGRVQIWEKVRGRHGWHRSRCCLADIVLGRARLFCWAVDYARRARLSGLKRPLQFGNRLLRRFSPGLSVASQAWVRPGPSPLALARRPHVRARPGPPCGSALNSCSRSSTVSAFRRSVSQPRPATPSVGEPCGSESIVRSLSVASARSAVSVAPAPRLAFCPWLQRLGLCCCGSLVAPASLMPAASLAGTGTVVTVDGAPPDSYSTCCHPLVQSKILRPHMSSAGQLISPGRLSKPNIAVQQWLNRSCCLEAFPIKTFEVKFS